MDLYLEILSSTIFLIGVVLIARDNIAGWLIIWVTLLPLWWHPEFIALNSRYKFDLTVLVPGIGLIGILNWLQESKKYIRNIALHELIAWGFIIVVVTTGYYFYLYDGKSVLELIELPLFMLTMYPLGARVVQGWIVLPFFTGVFAWQLPWTFEYSAHILTAVVSLISLVAWKYWSRDAHYLETLESLEEKSKKPLPK